MPATSRTPTTPRASSRAASSARNEALEELKKDHQRVKKAYKRFEKLDAEQDAEECEQIVQQVLDELTLHAAIEEEVLYPAARGQIDDDLLDEAEVEHESMHQMIDQLRTMTPDDDKYAARFTVLCEYVLHHVKEEEGEIFPKLERARQMEWEAICEDMRARREDGVDESLLVGEGATGAAPGRAASRGGRGMADEALEAMATERDAGRQPKRGAGGETGDLTGGASDDADDEEGDPREAGPTGDKTRSQPGGGARR